MGLTTRRVVGLRLGEEVARDEDVIRVAEDGREVDAVRLGNVAQHRHVVVVVMEDAALGKASSLHPRSERLRVDTAGHSLGCQPLEPVERGEQTLEPGVAGFRRRRNHDLQVSVPFSRRPQPLWSNCAFARWLRSQHNASRHFAQKCRFPQSVAFMVGPRPVVAVVEDVPNDGLG